MKLSYLSRTNLGVYCDRSLCRTERCFAVDAESPGMVVRPSEAVDVDPQTGKEHGLASERWNDAP